MVDVKKIFGLFSGESSHLSMVIVIAAFVGGMAVGKWACKGGDGTLETGIEKIPVPASSGEEIVDAVKVERDLIASELKKLQEKLRRREKQSLVSSHLVDSRFVGPVNEFVESIEFMEVGDSLPEPALPEILKGQALFPDSALGRVDTVDVTSYGSPIRKMDIQLHRGPGEISDLDTVRVPPVIVEGVELEWVAVIGLSMFILGAVTLGH